MHTLPHTYILPQHTHEAHTHTPNTPTKPAPPPHTHTWLRYIVGSNHVHTILLCTIRKVIEHISHRALLSIVKQTTNVSFARSCKLALECTRACILIADLIPVISPHVFEMHLKLRVLRRSAFCYVSISWGCCVLLLLNGATLPSLYCSTSNTTHMSHHTHQSSPQTQNKHPNTHTPHSHTHSHTHTLNTNTLNTRTHTSG